MLRILFSLFLMTSAHADVLRFEGERCHVQERFATGERWICGSGHPYYELLHTFGRSDAAAIEHGRLHANGLKDRVFFKCRIREKDQNLTSIRCDRLPPHRDAVNEGELTSPIQASTDQIAIPNAHQVGPSGVVFRSMAPKTPAQFDQLKSAGVRHVLIFKNEMAHEVRDERAQLQEREIHVTNIAFPWKDFEDFKTPCTQTIQALKELIAARDAEEKILFHCTVGEDRTGYLAAMFRLITEPNASAKNLFFEEMCERGYDLGDAYKPYFNVAKKIRDATTVLYLKMATKFEQGEFNSKNLNEKICSTDPAPRLSLQDFKCKTSTRFRPLE